MTGKSGGSDRLSHAGGGQHTLSTHTHTHTSHSDNNGFRERNVYNNNNIIVIILHVCERAICHYYVDNAKKTSLSPPFRLFRQTS